MSSLETYLSDLAGPQVKWIKARVQSINSGFLTLTYLDGVISNASYLRQYTPVVGDIVHCLSYESIGVLVLGTAAAGTAGSTPPVPQTPIIISAGSTATYDTRLSTWIPGTVRQAPNLVGCFFYLTGAFTSLATVSLQKVEIEITLIGGGPPEFIPHKNTAPSGALSLIASDLWRPEAGVTGGSPIWVPLPIGWGKDLVAGATKGIAITTSLGVQGSYSGTGRVRFTPLSVTI